MATKPVEEVVVEATAEDVVEEAAEFSGVSNVVDQIKGLNNPAEAFYTSVQGADFETRKLIAKAMTSSEPLDEQLGEVLALKNYIVSSVDLADKDGNIVTAPRIVLLTADGKAYHATSVGILSAIRNLNGSVGEPHTWDAPIDIKVVEQKGRNGFKFFTINLV